MDASLDCLTLLTSSRALRFAALPPLEQLGRALGLRRPCELTAAGDACQQFVLKHRESLTLSHRSAPPLMAPNDKGSRDDDAVGPRQDLDTPRDL